jgi:hypothetical protein
MGMGNNSHICDVQNEPKNIFFGPELNEIQPVSLNSSKLAVSPSNFGHFGCSWTYFDGQTHSDHRYG